MRREMSISRQSTPAVLLPEHELGNLAGDIERDGAASLSPLGVRLLETWIRNLGWIELEFMLILRRQVHKMNGEQQRSFLQSLSMSKPGGPGTLC